MKPRGEEEEEDGAAGSGDPWKECAEVAVQLALRAGQVRAAPRGARSAAQLRSFVAAGRGWEGPGTGGSGLIHGGSIFPGRLRRCACGLSVKKGGGGAG